MNKKELKNIAKKIAAAELILSQSEDKEERRKAEDTIFKLSGKVTSLTDIAIIDEMVQDILSNT